MAVAGKRPLSPHLGIYRWGAHMLVSIMHRATGDGMAIVGSLVLVAWLGSAALGRTEYDAFIHHASAWYGQVVLIGLTWAFFQHASSGLRHLVLDTGAGYGLETYRLWSIVVASAGTIITAAAWIYIYFGRV